MSGVILPASFYARPTLQVARRALRAGMTSVSHAHVSVTGTSGTIWTKSAVTSQLS